MNQEDIHLVFQEVHQVWPISLAGTAIMGLVLWLMGRRMIRPAMTICGIFIGASLGFALSHHFQTNDGLLLTWTGVGAVAGALLAWLLYRTWMAVSLGLLAAVIVPATAIAFTGTPDPPDRPANPATGNIIVEQPSQLTDDHQTAAKDADPSNDDPTQDATNKDATNKDDGTDSPSFPVNQLSPEQIANAAADKASEIIQDIQNSLIDAIRAAYENQFEHVKAWWESMDGGQHKSLLTTTLIGVGIALLVGFMLPNVTASIETALIGTVMLFIATRGILATYSEAHVAWLPSKPQQIFITVGLITLLGILLQWTFFRKAADK